MTFTLWRLVFLAAPFWIGVATRDLCGKMTWWKTALIFVVGVGVHQALRLLLVAWTSE